MKKKNIYIIISLFIIIILSGYYFITASIGNSNFNKLKKSFSPEQRELIKKYIFPYTALSEQEEMMFLVKKMGKLGLYAELYFGKNESEIITSKSTIKLSNNKILKKYKLEQGFYYGIHYNFPGSGYIDFFENNLFVLSSTGILAFEKILTDDEINFQLIKNNINDFIGLSQFKKDSYVSLKDMLIFENKLFISYTEEIEEDCWNTSIIYGKINYKNIKFKKMFTSNKCVHSENKIDGDFSKFSTGQSGGRMIDFDKNHILLSIGDYFNRYLAQDKKSVNGKVIKINISNGDNEIISMGHRNPQGLLFDKENNFILETEHGPMGGDEINLIKIEKKDNNNIQNYGWPVVSAGEHYGGRSPNNKKKYEKYPLYKSHTEHGFIEPLKSFVPSIAISQIVKIKKNKYVVGSMGKKRDEHKSLYFFELSEEKKIINLEQIKVYERVRDLGINDNKLYLFMENTASIGIINLD